jgi:hypothetical protein
MKKLCNKSKLQILILIKVQEMKWDSFALLKFANINLPENFFTKKKTDVNDHCARKRSKILIHFEENPLNKKIMSHLHL